MDDENQNRELPSDEQLAEMIRKTEGGKSSGRDQDKPSPRLPEALYYYLFILVEALVLIGVWGFMGMGFEEALAGPDIDAPILDQLAFHAESMGRGILDVLAGRPWVIALVALVATGVFGPTTPRGRKRVATWVSIAVVTLFAVLIALQFSEDMNRLTESTPF